MTVGVASATFVRGPRGYRQPVTTDRVLAGRYRLVEPLGFGGMSVVWRAHDQVLDRPVAVKLLSEHIEAERRPLLRAEARAAARLSHPAIASVYDFGEARLGPGTPLPYLVMALVDGEPLDTLLDDGASLPWDQAAEIVARVADALTAVHAAGLVHRDVKPANIILTGRGPILVDFGICAEAGAPDVDDGLLLGTPAYVAPERLADAPVGPAADVYALGLLLYRMLAGRLPWPGDSTDGLLLAHLFREPDPLPAALQVPAALADLVMASLAKEPAGRPSAPDVALLLRHCVATAVEPSATAAGCAVPDSAAAGCAVPDSAASAATTPGSTAAAPGTAGPARVPAGGSLVAAVLAGTGRAGRGAPTLALTGPPPRLSRRAAALSRLRRALDGRGPDGRWRDGRWQGGAVAVALVLPVLLVAWGS